MPDNRGTMKSKIVLYFAVFLAVLAAPLVSAEAQPLTDAQIGIIRQNCAYAQQILQRSQRNEAASRVNRGHGYETTLRLMTSFNSRVALNKINAPKLAELTTQVEDKFDSFRTDYIAYDDQLETVLKLKCREQPVTFYDELTLAREARAKVAKDIADIDSLLDQYQSAVDELKATLIDASGTEEAQQ